MIPNPSKTDLDRASKKKGSDFRQGTSLILIKLLVKQKTTLQGNLSVRSTPAGFKYTRADDGADYMHELCHILALSLPGAC
jgi:hypothetical protein